MIIRNVVFFLSTFSVHQYFRYYLFMCFLPQLTRISIRLKHFIYIFHFSLNNSTISHCLSRLNLLFFIFPIFAIFCLLRIYLSKFKIIQSGCALCCAKAYNRVLKHIVIKFIYKIFSIIYKIFLYYQLQIFLELGEQTNNALYCAFHVG